MAQTVANDTLLRWLWLQKILTPGAKSARLLLDAFGLDIDRIYSASREDYLAIPKLDEKLIDALCGKDLTEEMKTFAYCRNYGILILTLSHADYPMRLRELASPPLVLYVRGKLPNMNSRLCISVVGTRKMTEYGSHQTYLIAHDIARAGGIIVSGMAKGVDGMAHRGCLDAGGETVAVLGCGVDRVYPPEHDGLMQEIMQHGAVISEFPPFSPPNGYHFPLRNRIISGLSQATLVTEADDKSGALITARNAVMQGRMVFSLPGKVGEKGSAGVNALLRDGANIATGAQDILKHFVGMYEGLNLTALPDPDLKSGKPSPIKRKAPHPLDRVLVNSEQKIKEGQSAISASLPRPPRKEDARAQSPVKEEARALSPAKEEAAKPSPTGQTDFAFPENAPATDDPSAQEDKVVKVPFDLDTFPDLSSLSFDVPEDPRPALSDLARKIIERIPHGEAITTDEIAGDDLPIRDVMVAMMELELSGYVTQQFGGRYLLR